MKLGKRQKRIHLSSPHMSGLELGFIHDAFEKNWIAPLGENVDEFEKSVSEYLGEGHCVALSSGTAAIHLGLKYLGVKKGDIVFCSSLTFSGSSNPILYLGAIPVFIDSDYETWNMDPKALEKAYEKYPNPKAVIVVNLYGQSADFDAIRAITQKHGTPILEDAAESLGSTYKGKQTGTFGDVGVFSFNGNKIITTSGGGMLVLKDDCSRKKIKYWAAQAKDDKPYYYHTEIGYNYRMSNIVAGIGRGQMMVLNDRIDKKRYIHDFYSRNLEHIPYIQMMPQAEYGTSNYWLTCFTLSHDSPIDVPEIIAALESDNIDSRHLWKPMHTQPIYETYDFFTRYETSSCAEDLFNRGICLPSDTKLTDEELTCIVGIIKDLFEVESQIGIG